MHAKSVLQRFHVARGASEETETGNLFSNTSSPRTLCRARRQARSVRSTAHSTIAEELRQENLFEQKQRLPINHEAKPRPPGRSCSKETFTASCLQARTQKTPKNIFLQLPAFWHEVCHQTHLRGSEKRLLLIISLQWEVSSLYSLY